MKKGFTLVELLAVIILLGLLGLIIYPTVNGVIKSNQTKLKTKQIEELERYAATWATTNSGKLKYTNGYTYLLDFNELYEDGIIQNDKVIDPTTDEELKGCIALTWQKSKNSFDIKYSEECVAPKIVKNCIYEGSLVQGAEFVDGQYTYRYKQLSYMTEVDKFNWSNIVLDGWGVSLTDRNSKDPVTTELCSSISGKPIVAMTEMFANSKTTSIDLGVFDTSNVVTMDGVFYGIKVPELDLSGFDTSKVTDMQYMFAEAEIQQELDLRNFDMSNVTTVSHMFYNTKTNSIDLSNVSASKLTNTSIDRLFYGTKAKSINLSHFDLSGLTYIMGMFSDTLIDEIDVSYLKIPNVTNAMTMFAGGSYTKINLTGFDTSHITTMNRMFSDCKATTLDLSSFDTSNVTNMAGMFRNSAVTTLDLSSFDMSKVTSKSNMFTDASATVGYARTQADADILNTDTGITNGLVFTIK